VDLLRLLQALLQPHQHLLQVLVLLLELLCCR
jgi:hypothetical protein